MKKLLALLAFVILAVPVLYGQGTVTLPGMTEVTSIAANDLLWVWLDPAGTNATRKIKASNLLARQGGCTLVVGSDKSGSAAIEDGDLAQARQCIIPQAATVVEIEVTANDGTPSVIVGRNRPNGASSVNLLSTALATGASGGLACSRASATTSINGTTSCTNTLQNAGLVAGDWLYLVSGTAGGVATRMTISVVWTW